jgi:PAS domain S-box-containing protein
VDHSPTVASCSPPSPPTVGVEVAGPDQGMLEAIDAGVIVQDASGRIIAHNAAAIDLLGLSSDQIHGRTPRDPCWRALRGDGTDLPGREHPAVVALRTGEPVTNFEMGVRRPDRSVVWLLVSSRLRRTGVREVVTTIVDVTAARSAERALITTRAAESTILRTGDKAQLPQAMCDAILTVGGHRLVWIAMANEHDHLSVTTVAAAGETDYLIDGIVCSSSTDPALCGPVGTALRDSLVIAVDDIESDPRFSSLTSRARDFGFASMVAIPFEFGRCAVLAIYASDAGAFDQHNLTVMSSLGQNLGHALSNLERRQQLDTAFESTVTALATLSEVRDPYTSGHQDRVAELSVAIGERLGLGAFMLWSLRLGGLVHDIGKTMVPSEILTRPGRLDPTEFALVQRHTTVGEQVLRAAELPWPIPDIALQHHERLDGSGYPHGLTGDAICLPPASSRSLMWSRRWLTTGRIGPVWASMPRSPRSSPAPASCTTPTSCRRPFNCSTTASSGMTAPRTSRPGIDARRSHACISGQPASELGDAGSARAEGPRSSVGTSSGPWRGDRRWR